MFSHKCFEVLSSDRQAGAGLDFRETTPLKANFS